MSRKSMPGTGISTFVCALILIATPGARAQSIVEAPPEATEGTTPAVELAGSFDLDRAASDPAYAEQLLQIFTSLAEQQPEGGPDRAMLDGLRAYLLVSANRPAEGTRLLDLVLARDSPDPRVHRAAWMAAVRLGDPQRLVAVLTSAARAVRPADRGDLHDAFGETEVWWLIGWLEREGPQATLDALIEALAAMDWPGAARAGTRDTIRIRLVDRMLDRQDRSAAAALARRIESPSPLVRMAVVKRYDSLWRGEEDREARLRLALTAHDRATADALAVAPDSVPMLVSRAQFLISVGRAAEALVLLQPHLTDIAATVASDSSGHWLIDHAAFAMLMMGRPGEGAALYQRLAAVPIELRDNLLDTTINHANYLWLAGRHEEALAQVDRLGRDFDARMNDFGRMWTWSMGVCAAASLGRSAAAQAWLERMRERRDHNPGAMMNALLCLGDMAAAEAFLLDRLRSDAPGAAVLALQDWQVVEAPGGPGTAIAARLAQLRQRPAVLTALKPVGRVLPLPMARSYWGSY
jgi:hypothetical protein